MTEVSPDMASAIAGAVAGAVATKGVDAINRFRKQGNAAVTEGYKVALDDLRLRVAALELALSSSERGHRECLEKQARMSVTVQFMQAEIDEMKGKK